MLAGLHHSLDKEKCTQSGWCSDLFSLREKIQHVGTCTQLSNVIGGCPIICTAFFKWQDFLTLSTDLPCSSSSVMCRASPLMGCSLPHCFPYAGWQETPGPHKRLPAHAHFLSVTTGARVQSTQQLFERKSWEKLHRLCLPLWPDQPSFPTTVAS